MDKKQYIAPSMKAIDILSAEMLATSTVAFGVTASTIDEANRRRNENLDWSDPWN